MARALKLHTLPDSTDLNVKVGEVFPIVHEDDHSVFVEVDVYTMEFTHEPDEEGYSLHNWFDIVEEA